MVNSQGVNPLARINGPNPPNIPSSNSAATGPRSIARGFTPWTASTARIRPISHHLIRPQRGRGQ